MRRIIRNAIQCNNCGDIIESEYRHHYVQCKCGDCAVDGGHDYLRRCYVQGMNEMHSITKCDAFSYGFRLGVQLMAESFLLPLGEDE